MIGIVKKNGKRVSLCRKITQNGVTYWTCFNDKDYRIDEIELPEVDRNKFLNELHSLLEKYNASIYWACSDDSDVHGVYDSHLGISLNGINEICFSDDIIDSNDVKKML